ncbi:hypothetical protein QVD17_09712 [Tagetes erecta]|uniref:Uncharacterized protein n=1 Tax=Tagetes erecta TaxID=13708 RepID=A0AAD8P5J5_TARER|nr:hypothetical protein QVD17_09712 [Tagetes erecta]
MASFRMVVIGLAIFLAGVTMLANAEEWTVRAPAPSPKSNMLTYIESAIMGLAGTSQMNKTENLISKVC